MLARYIVFEEMTTQPDLTWLLWAAMGFFVTMVLVGWLVSRTRDARELEAPHQEEKRAKH